MNPRQRRGVLLILLSIVGAVSVFVAVSGYVADVGRQVGDVQQVVRLTTDVGAFQPIPVEAMEVVDMPARWKPPLALGSPSEVEGLVPAADLPAGTLLEAGDITSPPTVGQGERQIAILVDAETGVAGEIQVGDIVDIIATRDNIDNEQPRAEIAIEAARILSIGTPRIDESVDPVSGTFDAAFAGNEQVPITFVLPTSDVLRLAYVETFATTVRLALRNPQDDDPLQPPERVYAPAPSSGGAQ